MKPLKKWWEKKSVDKLTKEEAFAMAKMLNFVGEVEE
jgi:hypothetical protein